MISLQNTYWINLNKNQIGGLVFEIMDLCHEKLLGIFELIGINFVWLWGVKRGHVLTRDS